MKKDHLVEFEKKILITILIPFVLLVGLIVYKVIEDKYKTKSYEYQYKVGECSWHISQSKNEDGTYKRNIFKIIDFIEIEDKPYYIADVLNWHYQFNHASHKLVSASYYDKYHPQYTHEQKCRQGMRKDLVEECVKDKNWDFNTGGMECPTREEYCKDVICWEK